MSKELEPIEALDKLLDGYSKGIVGRSYYDVVREALQRLESIENVKPSEVLEAFGRITLHTEYDNDSHYDGLHFEDDCKLVDKALLKAEKEHKALEIIKKTKNIKVGFYENGSGKHYKIEFDRTRNQTITKEEFNLLKEVLE